LELQIDVSNECTLKSDLTGDCYIDLNDLMILAENWLQNSHETR
jgi:hypothetical protein